MVKRFDMGFKSLIFITILESFIYPPSITWAESSQAKMHSGVSKYKHQNYNDALVLFSEAKEQNPNNPELSYNLANSQFKSGYFPEALQAYSQSYKASTNPKLQQKALYNRGNTFYRMGKLEEAIGSFKKALEIDSSDMDAKFNLEFVREQLKKKQQKQKSKLNKNPDVSQDRKQQSNGPNPPDQNQTQPQPIDPRNKPSKNQDEASTDSQKKTRTPIRLWIQKVLNKT